jgi:hypothetical protein
MSEPKVRVRKDEAKLEQEVRPVASLANSVRLADAMGKYIAQQVMVKDPDLIERIGGGKIPPPEAVHISISWG